MAKFIQVWGEDVAGRKLNHIYTLYGLFIDIMSETVFNDCGVNKYIKLRLPPS